MPVKSQITFASLFVSAQRHRRRVEDAGDTIGGPYHPARRLTTAEIYEHVTDGDDGLLWGAYDIPVYHNVPLD